MVSDPGEPFDVIFVSYDEPNAEENFARLMLFAPEAKRVQGLNSIYRAYQAAADLSATPRFFMIDGDNWIADGFSFAAQQHNTVADIYNWHAVNPVNGIVNTNGGIKLVRVETVRSMNPNAIDFYGSMKGLPALVTAVASQHRFNASPFLAWRGGFRECAKLTGGHFRITPEKARELIIWQTRGSEKWNGFYCVLGARMGAAFGKEHRDKASRRLINDGAFLEETFQRVIATAGALDVILEEVTPP